MREEMADFPQNGIFPKKIILDEITQENIRVVEVYDCS